jgi:hypothetical protein
METTDNPETPEASTLAGFNVLLIGPAGTGKTHSLGTLVDTGIECFYLGLEPGLESLLGYYTDRGLPIPDNLHWHSLKSPQASFSELISSATLINTLGLDSLAKMQDPNKSKHNRFIELLKALNNFHDDRTGEDFGAVNTWTPSRALMIDGMTGLNDCAMSLVIGGKPVKNQSDWGIAQDQLYRLLKMLCEGCPCHKVVLAHVSRETDIILGGTKLMVASLGKALAPQIPSMFSDVILANRQGNKWTWDTANVMADLKTRNLEIKADLPPSFKPIVDKWVTRGGRF